MRKFVIIICLIAFSTSCEDIRVDQGIDHISRKWSVYKFEIDGYDQTPLYTSTYVDYNITFTDTLTYTENYTYLGTPLSIDGIYIFSDKASILTLSDEFQSRVYNILTLTNNEMTLEDRNSDVNQVYYFEVVL
jgi:WD40 repeat protein